MKLKEEAIQKLNSVLNSKKSKLSKKDREDLIILREKLKNERSYSGLFEILKELVKIAGAGAQFFGDS